MTALNTKTSVALAPKATTTWREVRIAIAQNIDVNKGNAFYVNLRTGKCFHIAAKTGLKWKKFP